MKRFKKLCRMYDKKVPIQTQEIRFNFIAVLSAIIIWVLICMIFSFEGFSELTKGRRTIIAICCVFGPLICGGFIAEFLNPMIYALVELWKKTRKPWKMIYNIKGIAKYSIKETKDGCELWGLIDREKFEKYLKTQYQKYAQIATYKDFTIAYDPEHIFTLNSIGKPILYVSREKILTKIEVIEV